MACTRADRAGQIVDKLRAHGCKVTLGLDCSFTWLDEEFLLAQGVRPYMELPLWLPDAARGHFDVDQALAKGLACRPVIETIRDTLNWHLEQRGPQHKWRAGMKAERERELLDMWREQSK